VSADVFVDRTGRRRRVLAWLAVTAAAVLVGALGLLAAGLFAGGPLPLQGWTDHGPPGPDTAVIGPAPTPAAPPTAPSDESSGQPRGTAPTARPSTTSPDTPSGTGTASDRPGRGNGQENRPTAKPSHPQPKTG